MTAQQGLATCDTEAQAWAQTQTHRCRDQLQSFRLNADIQPQSLQAAVFLTWAGCELAPRSAHAQWGRSLLAFPLGKVGHTPWVWAAHSAPRRMPCAPWGTLEAVPALQPAHCRPGWTIL